MTTVHITDSQRDKLDAAREKLVSEGTDISGSQLAELAKVRKATALAYLREKEAEALQLSETPEMPSDPEAFKAAAAAMWPMLWTVAQGEYADRVDELVGLSQTRDERALAAEEKADEAVKAKEAAEAAEARMREERDAAVEARDKALEEAAAASERALKAEGAESALEARIKALEGAHERELANLKAAYESKK